MSASPPASVVRDTAVAAVSAVFVLLWSTGFMGARFVLPHSEPLTVLVLRFAVMALIAWALFDERLGPLALAGMGVAVRGVLLASRRRPA